MNAATQTALSEKDLAVFKKMRLLSRAIDHPLRKKMLDYLHQDKGKTVTDLYIALRLEQSVASQHLAILRKAGFVTTKKDGKHVYYSIDYDRIASLVNKFNDTN